MKKIIAILFVVVGVFYTNQLSAYSCAPCGNTWASGSTAENYNGCSITINYEYQKCSGECYFRITSINDPNHCLSIDDFVAILEWGTAKMISHANQCAPIGPNNCVESIKVFNAACWRFVSAGPQGQLNMVPCQENSCCEGHWMWCNDAYGVPMTPYQTYLAVNMPCTYPYPGDCMVVCP